MNHLTHRYGGYLTLENPTVPAMKEACEELMRTAAKAANANPTLDLNTLRTWFQASQDIDGGGIMIRLYWSAQDERSGK